MPDALLYSSLLKLSPGSLRMTPMRLVGLCSDTNLHCPSLTPHYGLFTHFRPRNRRQNAVWWPSERGWWPCTTPGGCRECAIADDLWTAKSTLPRVSLTYHAPYQVHRTPIHTHDARPAHYHEGIPIRLRGLPGLCRARWGTPNRVRTSVSGSGREETAICRANESACTGFVSCIPSA